MEYMERRQLVCVTTAFESLEALAQTQEPFPVRASQETWERQLLLLRNKAWSLSLFASAQESKRLQAFRAGWLVLLAALPMPQ